MTVPSFKLEIKDIFDLGYTRIVFAGKILHGSVSIGDKLEFFLKDNSKVKITVKEVEIEENAKVFGIFPSKTHKKVNNASQNQKVGILVSDFFNVSKQRDAKLEVIVSELGWGAFFNNISKETLQTYSD